MTDKLGAEKQQPAEIAYSYMGQWQHREQHPNIVSCSSSPGIKIFPFLNTMYPNVPAYLLDSNCLQKGILLFIHICNIHYI